MLKILATLSLENIKGIKNSLNSRDLTGESNPLVKSTYLVTNSMEKYFDFKVETNENVLCSLTNS